MIIRNAHEKTNVVGEVPVTARGHEPTKGVPEISGEHMSMGTSLYIN
jgi:hypothetical protein